MDGRFLLPLSAENREAAGVVAGDEVEVDIELDVEPRVVEAPRDVATAIAADARAQAAWDSLSNSRRNRIVLSVDGAKSDGRVHPPRRQVGGRPARRQGVTRRRARQPVGSMLWFSRKRLSGSYCRLTSTSRARFGP